MAGVLEKLFGSPARVKIIRLFFLNPGKSFTSKDIILRAKVKRKDAVRELSLLGDAGFIKKISFSMTPSASGVRKKKKVQGWAIQPSFPFFRELKNFVLSSAPLTKSMLLKKLRGLGKVRLIILSGTFLQYDDSRTDILVVGDGLKQSSLEKVLKDIEAEIGKELNYALLTTNEFKYRIGMYDKFIRDILDYPHEKLLDKIGVE